MSIIEVIAGQDLTGQQDNTLLDAVSAYEKVLLDMKEALDNQVRQIMNDPTLEGK